MKLVWKGKLCEDNPLMTTEILIKRLVQYERRHEGHSCKQVDLRHTGLLKNIPGHRS